MKTTTFKSLLVKLTLILILMVSQVSAQNSVGTRIDVKGTMYSDKMWIFTVATCTRNFDNGWDGFKMFGSSITPQLYALEPDGNYQIDVIPNINNTCLGFSAGIDSLYTFTFTHQNLSATYQQLYLIDSVANKTIDIYQTGTTYKFKALASSNPIKRFKIVTSKPAESNQNAPITTDINETNSTNHLKIYSSEKNIYIENPNLEKGKINLCSAATGKIILTQDLSAQGNSIINTNISKGVYIVNGVTLTENVSSKIIIQ